MTANRLTQVLPLKPGFCRSEFWKKPMVDQQKKFGQIRSECDRNHKEAAAGAGELFKKILLKEELKRLSNKQTLDITVVCAGQFPSCAPLLEHLKQGKELGDLQQINFNLVDPSKKELAKFEIFINNNLDDPKHSFIHALTSIKCNFKFYDCDLMAYLKSNPNKSDIFYFEHPASSTTAAVLALMENENSYYYKFHLALPYLRRALNRNGIIIMACKNSAEVNTLNAELSYSLEAKTRAVNVEGRCVIMKDYNYGGVAIPNTKVDVDLEMDAETKNEDQRSKHLHRSYQALTVGLFSPLLISTGTGLVALKATPLNTVSIVATTFLCPMLQMAVHRPGNKNYFFKAMILLAQVLLFYALYQNDQRDLSPVNTLVPGRPSP